MQYPAYPISMNQDRQPIERQFKHWPLLDREQKAFLGPIGIIFVGCLCVSLCLFGFFCIRPWSVLEFEDLYYLGLLGCVAIPLAAWLIGGYLGIFAVINVRVFHWIYSRCLILGLLTKVWLALSAFFITAGAALSCTIEPFYYGYIAVLSGLVIWTRTVLGLWAHKRISANPEFP